MKRRLVSILLTMCMVITVALNMNTLYVSADDELTDEVTEEVTEEVNEATDTDAVIVTESTDEADQIIEGSTEEGEYIDEEFYTITYIDAKTNPDNPEAYQMSDENIMLNSPTWKGHTFKGWYYDSDFTRRATMIKAGTTGDKTFYAKWVANKYTVKFDGNNSTSGTMKDMTCEYGTTYILRNNTFKRKGYTFTGWNTKANGSGKTYVNEDEIKNLNSNNGVVITLYAQWKANTYYIDYRGYRATNGSMGTVKYQYDKSYTLAANKYKKTGYNFTGWNTKSDGTGRKFKDKESIKNLTAVDGNTLVLYTQWELVQYKIVYGLQGGVNNSTNPTTYNVTTSTITLKNPTKTGYLFKGWYSDSAYTTRVTSIPKGSTGKKSLYAKWELLSYTINYYPNGGSLTANAPKTYNVTTPTFNIPEPVREGYTFEGWYRNSDFSGARITSINTGTVGTINLYAKWTKQRINYGKFVINKRSGKVHLPNCSSVSEMYEKNKVYYEGYLDDLKKQGYDPCNNCLYGY